MFVFPTFIFSAFVVGLPQQNGKNSGDSSGKQQDNLIFKILLVKKMKPGLFVCFSFKEYSQEYPLCTMSSQLSIFINYIKKTHMFKGELNTESFVQCMYKHMGSLEVNKNDLNNYEYLFACPICQAELCN